MAISHKTAERNKQVFNNWRMQGCANPQCPADSEWLKTHPWAIDADHKKHHVKVEHVSDMIYRYGTPRIVEELSKCQPLCKLCHAEKTYLSHQK